MQKQISEQGLSKLLEAVTGYSSEEWACIYYDPVDKTMKNKSTLIAQGTKSECLRNIIDKTKKNPE